MTKRSRVRDLDILLVEDSKAEALYIERTLMHRGSNDFNNYKVMKARSIAQALTLLDSPNVDVVLLDLGLPDASGFSGLLAIHCAAPKVPIVILTGQDDPDLEFGAMESGAQEYLLKNNSSPTTLSRTIRQAIQRKQVENMKSEFISLVSHELRTPLTAIHGSLGLINGAMTAGLPSPVARLLAIAQQNSDRLIRLVNDILDIDMIDSGHLCFDIGSHDVEVILLEAARANLAYGETFGITYVVKPMADELRALVDPSRLTQVMANLLSNAAKFSPAGGQVEIAAEQRAGFVRVSVSDRGCGIDAAFHGRIFQKFSQSDTGTTRRTGGAGLGLYICKQMVEHMHGKIGFDSEAHQGTTFYVDLVTAPAVARPKMALV